MTAGIVVDTHAASLTLKPEGNLTVHLTETLQRFGKALPILNESGCDVLAQPDYRISIVAYVSQVVLGHDTVLARTCRPSDRGLLKSNNLDFVV